MSPLGAAPFPNVVIRASAGTGKTFQLSNRFLGLAVRGEPLDAILATTFTRKAAGEILDRILVRLADAALDDQKRAELGRLLGLTDLDRADCLAVLGRILGHLHRLRVGTLDHFFIQMARSFSLELGLPPGWQILDELDDRRLQAEAVGEMLEGHATGDTLRLMHLLTKGDVTRSVSQQLLQLVRGLYAVHVECPAEAWTALPRAKSPEPRAIEAARAVVAAAALPGKQFNDAREKDLAKFDTQQWEAFLQNGLAAKIADGSGVYRSKPIPEAAAEAYEVLVAHARAHVLGAIANQTAATGELLARFDRIYTRRKLARRGLRFDDVTRRLGDALPRERLDRVVYRLDANVAHLLLDEFQDTSAPQWRVLRPFARRLTADSPRASFFCVGDTKQAIYGWRGGVAEIFDAISDELTGLDSRELVRSFRSAPPVIDAVNRVFGSIGANPALAGHADAARRWAGRFATHATARTDLPGHVALRGAPRAEQPPKQGELTLQHAADRALAWRGEAPGATVGILARTNKSVARLIFELRRRGVEASEEGGNPLVDAPAVELILSALSLADHPGDTAARFHVSKSPLGEALGLARHDDDAAAWQIARQIRAQLMSDGFGPTLYDWARRLADECDSRDVGRLVQLIELAYHRDEAPPARIDDFIAMVRQRKVEDPSSAPVRVMTVHQAKGLEFDVVILPELDVKLFGQPPQLVVDRASPAEPIHRVCRYVAQKTRALLPAPFAELFVRYESQVVGESLCVLYVAMTRAAHALEMIVAPSKENEKTLPATLAGVLRAALGPGGPVGPETTLFETGDRQGVRRAKAEIAKPALVAPAEAPPALRLAPAPDRPRRGLDRRSPSRLEGGPKVELAFRMRLDTAALDRGTLLHAWFERIAWLDDGEPDEAALRRIGERLGAPPDAMDAHLASFRAALARPAVRAVLQRAQYEGPDAIGPAAVRPGVRQPRLRVWRERPFAVLDEGAILGGTIDRLVVLHDGDKAIGANVLDFKTDAIPPGDSAALAARTDVYRPQLSAYRRAVSAMFALPADRVSARLVFVEPGAVVEA
ncbi:MAG: UvrD-helicase domain-containing protein [Pirellulales bacterium]|nr:UvrD-helicase domain-containing protein [Pirellulales bacterium]